MKSPKIDRLNVLDTALSLLEKEGIEGLTMRKLADALHIKAASLYWHFDNKQTLIEGMADRRVFAGTYVISENVLRINNTLITLIMQSGASAELASNMSMTLLYFILGCCIEQQAITLIDSEILMQKRLAFEQIVRDKYPQTWQVREILFADDFAMRFNFGLEQLVTGFEHQLMTP